MSSRLFVTGIGTGIGKSVVSAILCEALGADYWKPVQAGNLDDSDSMTVSRLVSNPRTKVHSERYRLTLAASPHTAAAHDGIEIERESFVLPGTSRDLVIEGAGGVLVPLAKGLLVVDLIKDLQAQAVVVSRSYLGSINHTLLTVEALKRRGIPILGIVFNGPENRSGEDFIREHTELRSLGRVEDEPLVDQATVSQYASRFRQVLHFLLRRPLDE